MRFAAGENPFDDEKSLFDFNKFIQYPEEFLKLDDALAAWARESLEHPEMAQRERPKDGYSSGGYEWCIANWGTQWTACGIEKEGPTTGYDGTVEVVFHFDTAWSPPKPVIKNAAERYPALTFDLRYFECGCCFRGVFRCKGGEVEEDASGEYFG
ncbi:MAG TPA: hypothetical protein VKP69_07490, partial [Isosphaeraceae bacterium]|nr:hypothetical protein [Isosphaeraceae bacterium]